MYSVLLLAAMAASESSPAFHKKGYVASSCNQGHCGWGTWKSWGSAYGGCYGIGYTGWEGVGGWGHPHASTAGWGLAYGADVGWGSSFGGQWPGYACYGGCGGYASYAYSGGAMATVPGTVVHPGAQATKRQPATTDQSARLVIDLPEGARLFVDDQPIAPAGASSSFRTPALDKGERYYYDLRAEVTKDGQKVVEKRRVVLTAGQTVRADFRPMTVTVATAKSR